jgi:hypothetical protein
MLDGIRVGRSGLSQGRGDRKEKDNRNQKPDKLVYHSLTLRVKYSRKRTNDPDTMTVFL